MARSNCQRVSIDVAGRENVENFATYLYMNKVFNWLAKVAVN